MSIDSSPKAIQVIGQRKEFYRLRISESSCARKETVDILVTLRNGKQKIMQPIRITSIKEVEPAEPDQMNICQSNNYRKELSWQHFEDEPRVQERQQVKEGQS